jgi:uncharacterized protein YbjT (DUF2867 family)
MIVTVGERRTGSAGDRLLAALERRGCPVGPAPEPGGAAVFFLCPDPLATDVGPGTMPRAATTAAAARLLIVTRLGVHRDARSARLREAWALEEEARGSGMRVLTLRLGPLLGPGSPLWLRLRSRPALPRAATRLVNPVAEEDVVETLHRAIAGTAAWEGWYEVAGPEVWSLAELAALARESGPPLPAGSGAWEPPLAEIEEHRLAEAGPWLGHFGMSVRPLAERARGWAGTMTGRAA